ncbi:MAG: glycerol-3-phosphate acyltransferase, partial [Cyanobium sp.]
LRSALIEAVLEAPGAGPSWLTDSWVVGAGVAALAGHIWPVWLGWKGGKAVATGLGMLLGLTWPVGLACFGIFLTVLTVSRIVSLSSVVAALSLPLLMLGWFGDGGLRPAYLALALLTTALVLWRPRANLQRLLAGNEPRLGEKRPG